VARRRASAVAREARGELYRRLVIEAAERVFAERGYDAAKMQDVAGEAGVSLGTLYRCFPGKWELYRAIHALRGDELLARCEAALAPRGGPLENLLAYVTGYVEYLVAHPDYLRLHLAESNAWGFGQRFASRVQAEAWRRGHDVEAALFREGIRRGVFVDRDPALLVRMMAAAQQVQLAHWVEHGMPGGPERLVAEVREHVLRAFRLEPGGAAPRRLPRGRARAARGVRVVSAEGIEPST
jgi:AcrR family transcriptional regulator